MKRSVVLAVGSPRRATAVDVIILTDCWQVVYYQRCTADEVKRHSDRKCSCEAGICWEAWDQKQKLNWVVICCWRQRRFLCLLVKCVSDLQAGNTPPLFQSVGLLIIYRWNGFYLIIGILMRSRICSTWISGSQTSRWVIISTGQSPNIFQSLLFFSIS